MHTLLQNPLPKLRTRPVASEPVFADPPAHQVAVAALNQRSTQGLRSLRYG